MRKSKVLLGVLAGVVWAWAGCAGKPQSTGPRVVSWYGNYALDEELELQVASQGMTRIRYQLRHAPSNRVLLSDFGTDSDGWFLIWDDKERLWGHWNDVGTVVWVPSGYMTFEKHRLTPGSPLLADVPPTVSAHLPDWVKRSLGL